MRKMLSWGGWGIFSLLLVQAAWGVQPNLTSKPTIVVDDFQLTKPADPKWENEKSRKTSPGFPIHWVINQAGRNPRILLKTFTEESSLMRKGLHQYALHLKDNYQKEGIFIRTIEQKTVNGLPVALLHGDNADKDDLYLIGFWRHGKKTYVLECSAEKKDFAGLVPEFKKVMETARFLKKH